MTTKIISLKNYRQNITKLWKEAKKNNICYIVLNHSSPILEVRPFHGEELIFQESDYEKEHQQNYYKTLEQTLNFWSDKADDGIFQI